VNLFLVLIFRGHNYALELTIGLVEVLFIDIYYMIFTEIYF